MNLFKKSNHHPSSRNRPSSPSSFEIPRLCLTRQKRSSSVDSSEATLESVEIASPDTSTKASSSDSSTPRQHDFEGSSDHLKVPVSSTIDGTPGQLGSVTVHANKRSNSFDNATQYVVNLSDDNSSDKECGSGHNLAVPKRQLRRASWEIPKICLHCLHIETLANEQRIKASSEPTFIFGEDRAREPSPTSSSGFANSSSDNEDFSVSDSEIGDAQQCRGSFYEDVTNEGDLKLIVPVVRVLTHLSNTDNDNLEELSCVIDDSRTGNRMSYTDVVSLAVPVVKPRSTSLDATLIIGSPVDIFLEDEPQDSPRKKQIRSKSVDSNMPKRVATSTALMSLVQQGF
ncbi:unnamed protein product, partial [Candidula unifasciata]